MTFFIMLLKYELIAPEEAQMSGVIIVQRLSGRVPGL